MLCFEFLFLNYHLMFAPSTYGVFLSRVMVKDPFHANCLPVHIGTLVELNKANGKNSELPYFTLLSKNRLWNN